MTKKTLKQLSPEDELEVLRKVMDITTAEVELDGVLSEIIRTMSDMVACDSVMIYLLDDAHRNLVLRASKTPHQKELGQLTLKIGEGLTGWAAKNAKTLAIREEAYKDPRFRAFDILPEDRYEAFLALPVVFKGKPIGVINLQHKKPHEYSSNVIGLLEMIARQLGGVIEHARLFSETRNKALQFDSLVKVSQSITSEKYLDEILSLIVVVTAEMLNSKICSVMLLDPKGLELVIRATQSLSEEYRRKPNLKVGSSLIGEAVRNKKPLTVENVQSEERYYYRELAIKEGLTSMIAVPMIVREKVVGVLNVYTKAQHSFSRAEQDVLQMVANQAAVAVENTKLMEEAFKAKEALETRKLVERAKGALMSLHHLSEDQAYRMINKKSMDTCKSMKEIAESILLMADLQKGL
jgi:signal transduction protein with GAF and PtsI domain